MKMLLIDCIIYKNQLKYRVFLYRHNIFTDAILYYFWPYKNVW